MTEIEILFVLLLETVIRQSADYKQWFADCDFKKSGRGISSFKTLVASLEKRGFVKRGKAGQGCYWRYVFSITDAGMKHLGKYTRIYQDDAGIYRYHMTFGLSRYNRWYWFTDAMVLLFESGYCYEFNTKRGE